MLDDCTSPFDFDTLLLFSMVALSDRFISPLVHTRILFFHVSAGPVVCQNSCVLFDNVGSCVHIESTSTAAFM